MKIAEAFPRSHRRTFVIPRTGFLAHLERPPRRGQTGPVAFCGVVASVMYGWGAAKNREVCSRCMAYAGLASMPRTNRPARPRRPAANAQGVLFVAPS